MRTRDPETGYICRTWLGHDYGAKVRCRRCGGRGMWPTPDPQNRLENVLCLKCADDWLESDLLRKYGFKDCRSGHKKWQAAFDEFCQTKPKDFDIQAHNHQIEEGDRIIKGMFPQYFTKEEQM